MSKSMEKDKDNILKEQNSKKTRVKRKDSHRFLFDIIGRLFDRD